MARLVRMIAVIWLFLGLIHCSSLWNTLYSYADGRAYLHLKDNSLISLNFTGAGSENGDDLGRYDLATGQMANPLPQPPANSTLFLANTTLYAMSYDPVARNPKDMCGSGVMSLYRFEDEEWRPQALDFSGIPDASMYAGLTIMASPTDPQSIYIFGGKCQRRETITDRIVSLDTTTFSLFEVSTNVKPTAFYGAGSVLAPSLLDQLILGGRSSQGWLSMYQPSIWSFAQGWVFRLISSSADGTGVVEPRLDPLVLPIIGAHRSSKSSESNISNVNISSVLVVGGEGKGGSSVAAPGIVRLDFVRDTWRWQGMPANASVNASDILGAATILNTLVVINTGSDGNRQKRDTLLYQLSLYDANSLKLVNSVGENWKAYVKAHPITTTPLGLYNAFLFKVVLGTVVPVLVIVILVISGVCVYKSRRYKQHQLISEEAYTFGEYSAQDTLRRSLAYPTPFAGQHYGGYSKLEAPYPTDNNDSSSSVGGDSIDSWMLKRMLYASERGRLVSDEQSLEFSRENSHHKFAAKTEVREPMTPDTPRTSLAAEEFSPVYAVSEKGKHTVEEAAGGGGEGAGQDIADIQRSVTRKSGERDMKKPRGNRIRAVGSLILEYEARDAQVLVSSKRRLILRVANPDAHNLRVLLENTASGEGAGSGEAHHAIPGHNQTNINTYSNT